MSGDILFIIIRGSATTLFAVTKLKEKLGTLHICLLFSLLICMYIDIRLNRQIISACSLMSDGIGHNILVCRTLECYINFPSGYICGYHSDIDNKRFF